MGSCGPGGGHCRAATQVAAGLTALLLLSACITTYRDYPRVRASAAELPASERALSYSIDRYPMLMMGKTNTLQDLFEGTGGFGEISRVEMPEEGIPDGLYVQVNVKAKNPSTGAAVWTYIAAAGLLTLLPAFSTKDGYVVRYKLFRDGEAQKTYRYEITRKFGVWIVFLPFIWINLFTPTEEKAFKATAYAFVKQAREDGLL